MNIWINNAQYTEENVIAMNLTIPMTKESNREQTSEYVVEYSYETHVQDPGRSELQ